MSISFFTTVGSWVFSVAAFTLFAIAPKSVPVIHCDCSEQGSEALNILRSQLDRCGHESLAARPCPPCPSSLGTLQLIVVGSAGVVLGISLGSFGALYCLSYRRQRSEEDSLLILDVRETPRRLPPMGSFSRRV